MAKRQGQAFENQRLVDRHGCRRQCDVIIKGNFAGQQLLGIVECKDRKLGTPEVDAFVTKARDINANFKAELPLIEDEGVRVRC